MTHRVAPRAEADLDDVWLYVAMESGSIEIREALHRHRHRPFLHARPLPLYRSFPRGRLRPRTPQPGRGGVRDCVLRRRRGRAYPSRRARASPARHAFRTLTHWSALPGADRHFLRAVLKCYH